ncbi:TnsA-like heteromeric transposase endonuclease subunit [Nocardia gipuzkoensis]
MRLDGAVPLSSGALWSHTCRWTELAVPAEVSDKARSRLRLEPGWMKSWSVTCRYSGGEVSAPVRDLGSLPTVGREPMRRFSWRRGQRHRSGLQYLISTGRHHGYESLAEARLLLMLDFAGEVTEVLAQPLRLRYSTDGELVNHTPDYLACTAGGGVWLIDVRPADRIRAEDEVGFAATAEVAALHGWGYMVVGGWNQHAAMTVDTLSAQRRPLDDRLGMIDMLLATVDKPLRFGELAAATPAPAIARAFLVNLLWHRRLGIDLSQPLNDNSLVVAAAASTRKAG